MLTTSVDQFFFSGVLVEEEEVLVTMALGYPLQRVMVVLLPSLARGRFETPTCIFFIRDTYLLHWLFSAPRFDNLRSIWMPDALARVDFRCFPLRCLRCVACRIFCSTCPRLCNRTGDSSP